MTVQSIKVRVQRRPSVKLKVLPRFPASVLASSPIQIDRTGGAYQFSLDIDALSVSVLSAKPITGTANEVSVAHGDGFGGNPTISLPNALTFTGKTVTGGTFNDILSMTAHKANSTANGIAATATLAQFYSGQSANPVTDKLPTVSISRYDGAAIDTAGSHNSALLVEVIGNQGNPGGGLFPQASGIVSRVTQNGFGDALGMGVEVIGNGGGGRFAYGYFFNVWAKVAAQAAFGIEGLIVNDTADLPFSSGNSVYLAAANLGAAGTWNTTAGLNFWSGFGKKFDVGILFGAGSIQQASIFDDSNSVTILKAYGSHTDGVDLTNGTFSGSPFKSTGFSVSASGVLAAATGSTVNGVAIVNLSATQTLTNKSMSGASNTFTNIPLATAVSGTLQAAQFPALTGDVTTSAGSLATAIGTGKVTNAMLAGSIAASKLVGTDIATVGTITSGTWNGSVIGATYGGFGANISAQSGVPLFSSGTATFTGTSGTGNFARVSSPTIATPTFTTSATVPLIVGGSATTGTLLELRTTSGSGTTDALIVTRGVNGGTLAMTVDNRGLHVGVGVNGASTSGDITLGRSGTTGVVYFGSNGGQYVYYDGSKYQFVGGNIDIYSGALSIATTKVVGARDTGWTAMTGTANKNTAYDTSTVTLAQLAGRVMSLQAALTTHGLIGV